MTSTNWPGCIVVAAALASMAAFRGGSVMFAELIRLLSLAAVATTSACSAPVDATAAASPRTAVGAAADDGTYLKQIDPLGGQWRVTRIGNDDFTPYNASINFSAGGFLNHGAGCHGGHPAFYRLDGDRLTITRREDARMGKCGSDSAGARAAESERRLTAFLDQTVAWSRPDDRRLILSARNGTRAVLSRPIEPHPELAGRWLIESIGGKPLITERRPPTVSIAMGSIGAHADCNSMGGSFVIPAPGRIAVTGSIMSTMIGCPPEDAAEDALMTRAIASAKAYRVEKGQLVFTGNPGMVLRRPPKPNRQLAGEYDSCGNTLLGGYHEGPITLLIDNQTMRDNAGCTASYKAEGPYLTLRLSGGPACASTAPPFKPGEPTGIGGKISTLAVATPEGFGFAEQGLLVLRTARGLLTMCRKGGSRPFGS